MADLVIDIGNTSLKASWCDGMTLGKTFRYQGERIFDYILSLIEDNRPGKLVLSSVRYLSSQNIERLAGKCDRLIIVDEDIMKRYDIPLHITPDRAASIIASKFPQSSSSGYLL